MRNSNPNLLWFKISTNLSDCADFKASFFKLFAVPPEKFSRPSGGKKHLQKFSRLRRDWLRINDFRTFLVYLPPEAEIFWTFRPCFCIFTTKNTTFSKRFSENFCSFQIFLGVQKISVLPNFFWGYRNFSGGVAHLRIFLYPQNKIFLGVHTYKKNTGTVLPQGIH